MPGKPFRNIGLATPKNDAAPAGRGRKPNGGQSQLDVAVEILKEANEALHCKEIVRRMLERELWASSGRTPSATLSASMQREIVKRGQESRFRKTKRGLYALNA